jgi:hypothetical protein
MTMRIKTLAAVAAGSVLATSAFAQSAREVRGASPHVAIENEPAPRLIVDPPLADQLARGIVLSLPETTSGSIGGAGHRGRALK